VRGIGESIKKLLTKSNITEDKDLESILLDFEKALKNKNISELIGSESGNLVLARRYEISAAINRIREDIIND